MDALLVPVAGEENGFREEGWKVHCTEVMGGDTSSNVEIHVKEDIISPLAAGRLFLGLSHPHTAS